MDEIASTAASARRVRPYIVMALALAIIGAVAWVNREQIAVQFAPRKQATQSRSESASKADDLFWQTFHNGEYENIPRVHEALTAAYLESPADAVTAAHLGWLHTWRVAERARLESVPATITDEWILARKYFREAVALDPAEARYRCFLAGATLAEASIHNDERLSREGYFMLRHSIKAWPEFNLFTAGYILSRQPAESPRFKEGLEWQWQNLCECVEEQVDRTNPDWSKYMPRETTEGSNRVCWNSWIAPHNFEGFFLNMGDMLVKSGDWQTARKIYANARLSRDYNQWKYREVLEERITRAEENVAHFNDASQTSKLKMMIDSEFSCMACHQQ